MLLKRVSSFFLVLIVCFAFTGCNAIQQTEHFNKKDNTEKTDILSSDFYIPEKNHLLGMEASSMKEYDTLEELKEDAHAIVLADVIQSKEIISYHDLVDIAISNVEIVESYKGEYNPGDVLSIEETGTWGDDGDFSIDGVPLLREHMRALLFLTEPDNTIQGDKEGYGIIGVYQGKFFVDGDNIAHQSAEFSDYADPIKGMKIQTPLDQLELSK